MKLKKILSFLSIILVSIALVTTSCNDDSKDPVPEGGEEETEDGRVPQKPDFEKKQTMDVSGFVTNESDEPLNSVRVQVGDSTVVTNEHGYFAVQNVNLVQDHSFVVAEKDGYFRGIRTWMGQKGGQYEVRIKLLPKTMSGSFGAQSGGEVVSEQGVKLTFPAEAIVTADGTAYTGKVNVAIQWLDAVANDFPITMPGDLSAIDAEGNTVSLISYGMAAVELTGESNELLQVVEGKTVNSVVPIAPELQSTAGEAIPLWYFDETKGMWVEEGVAKKEGNTYVGELGHFSWWNWDSLYDFVNVTARIIDQDGNPFAFDGFKYTINSRIGGYPVSDANGVVRFRMLENSSGELYLSPNHILCERFITDFSVGEEDVDLGDLVVPYGNFLAIKMDYTTVDVEFELGCDAAATFWGNCYLTLEGTIYRGVIQDNKANFRILACEDDAETTLLTCYYYVSNLTGTNVHYTQNKNVTINKKKHNSITVIQECETVTISGSVTDCIGKAYSGGYAEFVLDNAGDTYRSDIVNGKYEIEMKTIGGMSGRFLIYNKKKELIDVRIVRLKPKDNITYDYKMEDTVQLSGKVFGCNNEPMKNGVVVIESSRFNTAIPVNNGVYAYDASIYTCDNIKAKVIARDYDNSTEVSQEVILKPGSNNIPDMTICKAPVVEFNYLVYEYDGQTISTSPENVYGMFYKYEFASVRGYSFAYTYNWSIDIQWNIVKYASVGVFDLSGNLYIYDNNSQESLQLEGKVTIDETDYGADAESFKVRGTFVGETVDEDGVTKKPIKGKFYFNGKNELPV